MSEKLTFGLLALAFWSLLGLLLLWAATACWRRYETWRETAETAREDARRPPRVVVLAPELDEDEPGAAA